ncbi:hypothetical protein K7I13_08395 [Brucepastera parasyntrophica]|uniref:hypothetical protein n=1 Tax=Brucepastera parasyntrophica TaxID=2880008 RepID=UPI00210E3995|nr:hypothetical protein [Brucepastera parasyntrophica]ULQ58589.1 hypothetical protein K7I13_08395 [Brucepastera parasyntrophica]
MNPALNSISVSLYRPVNGLFSTTWYEYTESSGAEHLTGTSSRYSNAVTINLDLKRNNDTFRVLINLTLIK